MNIDSEVQRIFGRKDVLDAIQSLRNGDCSEQHLIGVILSAALLTQDESPEYTDAQIKADLDRLQSEFMENPYKAFKPCGVCPDPQNCASWQECDKFTQLSDAADALGYAMTGEPDPLKRTEARDVHPEDHCDKCGGPNICWFAPSELWNKVVADRHNILCPICFVKLAEATGFDSAAWQVSQEAIAPPTDEAVSPAVNKAMDRFWKGLAERRRKECDEAVRLLREGSFIAQTTGGTEGRDDEIFKWIGKVEAYLTQQKEGE